MRTNRVAWVALLGALPLLALAGCGPKAGVVDQDAHLGYGDLKQGGIAPLAAVTSEGDEELREPLLRRLESALRSRHDLRVMSAKAVRAGLGPSRHDEIQEQIEQGGRLPDTDLALLDSLIGGQVRYVAVARVEDQSIDQEEKSSTDAETGVTTITRSAVLRIRMAFSVYDLQACRRVWTGTVDGKDKKSASHSDEEAGFVESLLSSLFGLDKEYPDEPEADPALGKIFTTFAKRLPGG